MQDSQNLHLMLGDPVRGNKRIMWKNQLSYSRRL